ncbi:hypothetical protein BMS3Bbin02_01477 [bacterium BMS3Bbin02]|nr:hypothetical protein BMS3Bbin02_01477 [bacterium BMS3Bbin02]
MSAVISFLRISIETSATARWSAYRTPRPRTSNTIDLSVAYPGGAFRCIAGNTTAGTSLTPGAVSGVHGDVVVSSVRSVTVDSDRIDCG